MSVALSLGGATGGTHLSLGSTGADTRTLTSAAILPSPLAAAALRVDPVLSIAATLPAPLAAATLRAGPGLSIAAVLPAPLTAIRLEPERRLSGAASLPAPLAAAAIVHAIGMHGAASLPAPTATAAIEFDINIPNVTASHATGGRWIHARQDARALALCAHDADRPAPALAICASDAEPGRDGPPVCWETSDRLTAPGRACTADADPMRGASALCHDNSARITHAAADCAQQADAARGATPGCFVNLDRATHAPRQCWQDATHLTHPLHRCPGDGEHARVPLISCWQHGRYPHTWIRPTPVDPPYYPPQPPVRLCLGGTPGLTTLSIGREPCAPLSRRYYLMQNTATLTLLDGTPLPATAVSIRTDADSWAWALSATLAGSDAYAMVAPDPITFAPVEVLAEINGWTWRFVLDEPRHSRQFGRTAVSLSGRSRSAFLTAPYWAATSGTNSAPITVAQAAEQAVDSTGFTVDWSAMPDWTIPAGVLQWSGTPIERLTQLAAPADGCLLSHRTSAQLSAYPRYPARPIHWDDLELDHSIPESAIVSLERSDDTRARYNAVWISGSTHGCLADCWITGTDASQRAPDIADALLCDEAGVAARARALSVLGQAGPGWTLSAATLLQRPESVIAPTLVEPGAVVNLAGTRTLCRGVAIDARWSGDALGVRQTITLEQRAQEY